MRNQTKAQQNKQNMWYKKLSELETGNLSKDIRWTKDIFEITY